MWSEVSAGENGLARRAWRNRSGVDGSKAGLWWMCVSDAHPPHSASTLRNYGIDCGSYFDFCAGALLAGGLASTDALSFLWSPITPFSGQIENAGHFWQPTATAMGHSVMASPRGVPEDSAAAPECRAYHRGMTTPLPPPCIPPEALAAALRTAGHAALSPSGLRDLARADADALDALRPSWNELPPDAYLRDGGHYRRRRHSCFIVEGDIVEQVPHRAHWQPVEYNALHGGLERWDSGEGLTHGAAPVVFATTVRAADCCSGRTYTRESRTAPE